MKSTKNLKASTNSSKPSGQHRPWLESRVQNLDALLNASTSTGVGREQESDTKTYKATFFPEKKVASASMASGTEQSDSSRQEEEAVRRVSAMLLRQLQESSPSEKE
jgi:hypothetical protein